MTGLLVIAEQTFPVHLGRPSCSYAVTSNGTTFSVDGGTGLLGVNSPAGCGWGAVSNDDWINITRIKNDSGPGGISYVVAPSEKGAGSGTIAIGGQNIVMNQVNEACAPTVTSNAPAPFPPGGGPGDATVAAMHGCPWSVTADVDWITLSTVEGDGNGPVSYYVGYHGGSEARTGHIVVAGQSITVTQRGQP